GDECAAQLAIARGGRAGATPAPETAPSEQRTPIEQQPPQQQQQQQRPASPLQQLLPRLGR
ncbi:hypothetical protein, partial [Elioraea sp. Yellowstone]|uniref:hypothetical protein n=1 Tax=Elioraea sp. Yellowstone TaxID=2592070 RepID=UPI001F2B0D5E